MRIYLVRHGESDGNVGRDVHIDMPDSAIKLTTRGVAQAALAGVWLGHELPHRRWWHRITGRDPRARIWTSPYERTRQTAYHIHAAIDGMTGGDADSVIRDIREHVLLSEQQFGLFDGLSDEQLRHRFPDEHMHYDKHERAGSRFWARMPLGESRFDVAARVHQSFGTLQRDADRHGIDTVVVVCHGVTMRAFVMMWCHRSPEWFDETPNPPNGAVWLIDGHRSKGLVFTPQVGF